MARRNPKRLAEKLRAIRLALDLSQRGLIRRMGMEGELTQAEISMFESGRRIPGLLVLSGYAVLAGVWMDVLVSDEVELPKRLPARTRSSRAKDGNRSADRS